MESGQAVLDASKTSLYRTWSAPFVLTPDLLHSLADDIRADFDELQLVYQEQYEARHRGGVRHEYKSIDAVLRAENPELEPIVDLEIRFHTLTYVRHDDDTFTNQERYECHVTFRSTSNSSSQIILNISSNDRRWTDALSYRVQRQLERARNRSLSYQIVKNSFVNGLIWFLLIACMALLIPLLTILFSDPDPSPITLSKTELEALLNSADAARSVDDKIDFVTSAQRIILEHQLDQVNERNEIASVRQVITIYATIAIIVVLLVYSSDHHYPKGVYYWGDYAAAYDRIIKLREGILVSVVAAFMGGLLVNLFWLGLLG